MLGAEVRREQVAQRAERPLGEDEHPGVAEQHFAELGLDCHAEFMEALYQAGTDEMAQSIGEIDDQVDLRGGR